MAMLHYRSLFTDMETSKILLFPVYSLVWVRLAGRNFCHFTQCQNRLCIKWFVCPHVKLMRNLPWPVEGWGVLVISVFLFTSSWNNNLVKFFAFLKWDFVFKEVWKLCPCPRHVLITACAEDIYICLFSASMSDDGRVATQILNNYPKVMDRIVRTVLKPMPLRYHDTIIRDNWS